MSSNPLLGGPTMGVTGVPTGVKTVSPMPSGIGPQTMNSVMPPQQQCNVIYVDDMAAMLNHPTTPNEHFYFPERNKNIIWVRETDANGQIKNPVTRLTFTVDSVPFGPEAKFVTKEEHQQLYDLVSSMNTTINKLMEELGGTK